MFTDQTLRGQAALSNVMQTPQSNNPRDYINAIGQLAESDQPQLFGLPSNIDRSVQRFNSTQVINGLKNL
jgi:hypothetical protein